MGSKTVKAVYAFRSAFVGTISGIAAYEAVGPSNGGVAAGVVVGALVTLGLYGLSYKVYEYRVKKARARSKSSSNGYNFESDLYNQSAESGSFNSEGLGKILE